jgi:2',3'-cyclic-nucleotide 2'-phosphodiesterase (5'-nucleotidase family)
LLFHDTLRLRREGLSVALADRMRAATGAEIAILNTLALRGGLDGAVDPPRLAAAIPFRNQVVRLTLTGEQLARALAQGAGESTQHLVAVDADGVVTAVDSATPRTVATVDYLANGGRGNWTVFQEGVARVDTGLTLEDLALELLLGGVK